MVGRRPLGSALQLPAEALAFIHNQPPVSEQLQPPQAFAEPTAMATEPPESRIDESVVSGEIRPERPKTSRRAARGGELREAEERPSLLGELRVPLTTRLHPATADALRRANLEQRLKRVRPATQQEIVESAVKDWLKRNGYVEI
ncbi:MAG: hypothetical protein U0795_07335 [Pirellulales bacterium]